VGERRQYVVRFVAAHRKARKAQRLDQRIEPPELQHQIARQRRAAGFVAVERFVTKRRLRSVERQRHAVRLFFAQQLEQEHAEAVQRPGRLTAERAHRRQRMKRPEEQREGI
jgi:hypothetical protein